MSRTAMSAQRHALRALSQWPKDVIRPDTQLQDVLSKRFENLASKNLSPAEQENQLKQANALYSLVESRYKKKYPLTGKLLTPKSNPTYFTDLIRELEEAPTRSFLQRLAIRVKGLIRLQ